MHYKEKLINKKLSAKERSISKWEKKKGGKEPGNLNPQCSVDTKKSLEQKVQHRF